MADVFSKRPCSSCGGSGREYDRKAINHLINNLNMDLQDIAQAIGCQPTQLSKLMNGHRNWTPERIEKLLGLSPKAKAAA